MPNPRGPLAVIRAARGLYTRQVGNMKITLPAFTTAEEINAKYSDLDRELGLTFSSRSGALPSGDDLPSEPGDLPVEDSGEAET